ncbi:MAG: site-specific integrase, partial [Desulfobacteraceae bacterium]
KGKGKPWWVFITHGGVRKSKMVGDKQSAETVARAIRKKITGGDLGFLENKKMPSFGEYAEKWLKYIEAMRRKSTHNKYSQILDKHILPVFKDTALDRITRGDVRNFLINKIEEGLSRSSICVYRDVFSGVFNYAVDEEVIDSNPVRGITKRLELNRKREAVEVFSREEIDLLLDTSKELTIEFSPIFLMSCRTGMRLGELLAIRWGDIDFNGGFIWVRRSYRRGRFTEPKNGKPRRVDMSDYLSIILKERLTREKKRALKDGLGEVQELIFHRNGNVVEQNYLRRVFNRVLNKAGLRHVKFHSLRHSFASILLSEGESPVYVKEMLGHSSIQITVDIYGHWIQTEKKAGVNRLDTSAPKRTLSAPNQVNSHLTT